MTVVTAMALAALTPSVALAEEVPPSLQQGFLGTTPSLAMQYRLPDASSVGYLFTTKVGGKDYQPAAWNGLPEFRNTSVIGGGSFANAPGFVSKINQYWYDADLTTGFAALSINMSSFNTVDQAVAAVAADAKGFGTSFISLPSESGWQQWHGVLKQTGELKRVAWLVTSQPSPTVIRAFCDLYDSAATGARCQINDLDILVRDIALQSVVVTALSPEVLADLPAAVPGLNPVLAVSAPSTAVWQGLSPTKQLARALKGTSSTFVQYAPDGTNSVIVSLTVAPLANATAGRTFVTQVCGGMPEGMSCKRSPVSTAGGISVVGNQALVTRKGKTYQLVVQTTGAGALTSVSCSNGQDWNAGLTAEQAASCRTWLPAVLAASTVRQSTKTGT